MRIAECLTLSDAFVTSRLKMALVSVGSAVFESKHHVLRREVRSKVDHRVQKESVVLHVAGDPVEYDMLH